MEGAREEKYRTFSKIFWEEWLFGISVVKKGNNVKCL
jgi:hypothetical protein